MSVSKPERLLISGFYTLWKFSRPHTIIGTSVSVIGLALMALSATSPGGLFSDSHEAMTPFLLSWQQFTQGVMGALIPSLCANVYIVGLNQLEDVDIDRINKPALPLAAGELSQLAGLRIVAITGLLTLVLSWFQGYLLFGIVVCSVAIGTLYSLPPIRLKRFPFWAALCILGVRGVIVNLGFFLHFQHRWGGTVTISAEVWALTGFIVLFALAIALFKDMPDTAGDRQFQINTLTIQLGSRPVFNLSRWVLTVCYSLMVVSTILGWISVQPFLLLSTHLGLLSAVWIYSSRIDLQDNRQVSQFYQFIWKLFFLEYLIFPIACLWS
jgi:homogentisate phytyltransferase/homogentisate geranylgeranyltransferase